MHTEHIQYRGRYEYADRESLERALSTARATLGNDTLGQIATWLRFFVCRGTSLTVNMMVPDRSEHRFAAANVFLMLAHAATDGHVDEYPETCPIDLFDASDLDGWSTEPRARRRHETRSPRGTARHDRGRLRRRESQPLNSST